MPRLGITGTCKQQQPAHIEHLFLWRVSFHYSSQSWLLISQGLSQSFVSIFILFLWHSYWFCSSFFLVSYLLFHCFQDTNVLYYHQSPNKTETPLNPMSPQTSHPVSVCSHIQTLTLHGVSISLALIYSSALPSMVVATSPNQSCSFYDGQPSPCSTLVSPLTSEQSRHIHLSRNSPRDFFSAGCFHPLYPPQLTPIRNSVLAVLSLDNSVCA